jgi:hypothetical protein
LFDEPLQRCWMLIAHKEGVSISTATALPRPLGDACRKAAGGTMHVGSKLVLCCLGLWAEF